MLRGILAIILLLMLMDVTFAAKKKKRRSRKAKVENFLPKAFSAQFIQERKSATGNNKVIKSNLTVKYQYPKNFYMKKGDVDSTIYVCNRRKVWIYTPPFMKGEKGDLKTGSTREHCHSEVFDSLKNGLKDNKTYTVKKENETQYTLSFTSGAKKRLGVKTIDLFLKSKKAVFTNLDKIIIHYVQGKNPLTLKTKSLKGLTRFPKGTFTIKAPRNTNKSKI